MSKPHKQPPVFRDSFYLRFSIPMELWKLEKEIIEAVYASCNNNKVRTAKSLKIGLRTVQRALSGKR